MRRINCSALRMAVGICVMIALPIGVALLLVRHHTIARADAVVMGVARSALDRAESTADQLQKSDRAVNRMSMSEACSPAGIDLMRRLDLGSTMLQAVGRAEGRVIRCSSFGGIRDFDLGPADFVATNGAEFRTHVTLFDPKHSYLVLKSGSFVGIVHKDLALSFVTDMPGLGVGVFERSRRTAMLTRGSLPPNWSRALPPVDGVFGYKGRLFAVAYSRRYHIGAVAALPQGQVYSYGREMAILLLPLGLLMGLLLSAVLVRHMRARGEMPIVIRNALKNNEFEVVYQPVVELGSSRTVGAEALVRWRRSDGSFASPDNFIPAAEEAGLTPLITERVLELIAHDAAQAVELDPDFHFAVNVVGADLYRPDIVERFQQFVAQAGIQSRNVVIEVTERSVVDINRAQPALHRLRAAGIRVAIDDFGTGYSSLGYLAQLELDFLKIDKLFVHALSTDSATSQVAGRIIDMAKDLGLTIIAEGVETTQQATLLDRLGVELAQGYLFHRPMSAEDLAQRLRIGEGREHARRSAAA